MSDNTELLVKLEQLLKLKKSKAYYADRLSTTEEEVTNLISQIRNKDKKEEIPSEVTKEVNNDKGTLKSIIELDYEPKSDLELAKLHKIDLNKYKISNYWSKLKSNGKFTSSVFATLIKQEQKDKEKLVEEIKKSFSKIEKFTPSVDKIFKTTNGETAVFVYIADDHAGIDFKDSLFNNPYNSEIYQKRLDNLAEEVLNLSGIDKLFIVNLGDELDGFNARTTRYDHPLDSLSNKEQFDIYSNARKSFYDKIFTSYVSEEYAIININNSNHSGNDYSYIVNKALEFYIEARYSNVSFVHQEKFIDSYSWGQHTFLFTHGKDEKYMRNPFPFNLDPKTDLWLLDYSKNLKGTWFSTIKGDLHNYSVGMGKSGRYINVPSICGGSNWIEHNFGSSQSGALIEVVQKTNKNIISIPIWF